ncbi:hypothetical protein [Streptomyces sp. CA-111067]|uniref:hypothetical protein n=1 Tax=Streptomyces sp. CA-111067 TaxID=3240046 RepID=UPI003D97FC50
MRADGAAVRPGRVAAVAAAVSVLAMGGVAMAMATTGRLLPPGQGAGGGPVNRPPAAVSSGKATSAPPRRPATPAPPAAGPLPSAPYRDGCRAQSRTPYCVRASREATPHAGQRQRHPGSWPYRATGRPNPPGAPGPTGPTGPGRLTPVGPPGQTGRSAHAGPRPGRAPHASHPPAASNGQASHGRWSDDSSGDTYAR